MKDKRIVFTSLITLITFLFVSFLIYAIYCYGFYDTNSQNKLLEFYNNKNFDDIYENMSDNNSITKEKYYKVINLMYNQTELEKIYKKYYSDKNIYDIDSFIEEFYYGENKIELNDIEFKKEGKTTIGSRAKQYYETINVESSNGQKSSLGIAHNVKLHIDNKGILKIDGEVIDCENDICNVETIFKGLHEILYISNGYSYYGLLNVKDNNDVIVTNIDSLVTVDYKNNNQKINKGYYYLKACYLPSSCPSKKSSYIHVIDDKNIELKTYISLDQAGDYYKGTYEIKNGFLVLDFNSHIYSVFDYDTKQSTDIETVVKMQMRYRIIDSENLQNDDYYFGYTNN